MHSNYFIFNILITKLMQQQILLLYLKPLKYKLKEQKNNAFDIKNIMKL